MLLRHRVLDAPWRDLGPGTSEPELPPPTTPWAAAPVPRTTPRKISRVCQIQAHATSVSCASRNHRSYSPALRFLAFSAFPPPSRLGLPRRLLYYKTKAKRALSARKEVYAKTPQRNFRARWKGQPREHRRRPGVPQGMGETRGCSVQQAPGAPGRRMVRSLFWCMSLKYLEPDWQGECSFGEWEEKRD